MFDLFVALPDLLFLQHWDIESDLHANLYVLWADLITLELVFVTPGQIDQSIILQLFRIVFDDK